VGIAWLSRHVSFALQKRTYILIITTTDNCANDHRADEKIVP